MKPSNNNWARRQQCPCGDWKCYIKHEEDDETSSPSSQHAKTDVSLGIVFTPYVGQIFGSDEEAFEYYSNYARKNGFSIRKARSTESQNLGVYRRDFVCYRSGFNQPRKKPHVEHPRERKSVRCGCDAKLYLTKEISDGVAQWFVSQFSNVHNHELLEDDQVRLLPAYRKIQEPDQERILLLSKAGFPVNRIVKVLELEKGVQPGQLSFIEKDVRNFVRTCKKAVQESDALLSEKRENEVSELVEACKAMEERNLGFVYNYSMSSVNGSERVENIAWSYMNSIAPDFWDVVLFETSYRSTSHGLLLGLWFGINNHGKAILLGCVLLQDEGSHSLSWALQNLVQFMQGRHPQTILTDIDTGLRKAIAVELPNTKHVISIWHIVSKLPSWFSQFLGLQYSEFRSDFDVLCHVESVEAFELQWSVLVARYGIASDKHVALLYSYRASWLLFYVRSHFLARMMTHEFSQSSDSFMKRILSVQPSLQVFFEQVTVLANYENQIGEATRCTQSKTCLPIEEHARSVLTPYAFQLLQHEMGLSMQYESVAMSNGSYLVRHFKKMDGECLVVWAPEPEEEERIHCSCKEFEHSGILCRHSIRVLVARNYFEIPDQYFLLRWRRRLRENSPAPVDDDARASMLLAETLLSESSMTKYRLDYVRKELSGLLENVRRMPRTEEHDLVTADNNVSES